MATVIKVISFKHNRNNSEKGFVLECCVKIKSNIIS